MQKAKTILEIYNKFCSQLVIMERTQEKEYAHE